MNSISNLVRKKSRPAEVRGLSCLSLFSIGIKVSNAVQESVILALTVAQTSLIINLIAVNILCGANTQCYFYQKSEKALSLKKNEICRLSFLKRKVVGQNELYLHSVMLSL